MAKIMSVEDSGLIRAIIKKFVVEEGHEIIEVISGKDAVVKYSLDKPDLVFMDINLPGGVSGIDASEEIMKNDPEAKIVICSIIDKEEYKERAQEIGVKDYLVKPFSKSEIVEILHKYL